MCAQIASHAAAEPHVRKGTPVAALAGAGTRHTLFAAKKISAMASSAHA